MSDAIAMQMTEQCRELVANPRQWGLEPIQGLEPLDVSVKFNRAAAHTAAAFQVVVQMKITTDEGQTWRTERALVSQGKTKSQALEGFYNRMADPGFLFEFREVVRTHEAGQLDVLAKEALDARKAEDAAVSRAKDFDRNWVERKTDQLARKFGLKDKKVQA
jgi:hypothetical protein